jgi:hypothetical protein
LLHVNDCGPPFHAHGALVGLFQASQAPSTEDGKIKKERSKNNYTKINAVNAWPAKLAIPSSVT